MEWKLQYTETKKQATMFIIKRNSQYYAKQASQTVFVLEESEAFKFQDRQVAQAKANSLKFFYGGQPFEVIKIG